MSSPQRITLVTAALLLMVVAISVLALSGYNPWNPRVGLPRLKAAAVLVGQTAGGYYKSAGRWSSADGYAPDSRKYR